MNHLDMKRKSEYLPGPQTVVEESSNKKAFFKYEGGKLVEFDLISFSGVPIRLTKEEVEAASEFSDESLV